MSQLLVVWQLIPLVIKVTNAHQNLFICSSHDIGYQDNENTRTTIIRSFVNQQTHIARKSYITQIDNWWCFTVCDIWHLTVYIWSVRLIFSLLLLPRSLLFEGCQLQEMTCTYCQMHRLNKTQWSNKPWLMLIHCSYTVESCKLSRPI